LAYAGEAVVGTGCGSERGRRGKVVTCENGLFMEGEGNP